MAYVNVIVGEFSKVLKEFDRAPRPLAIERGQRDALSPSETVLLEQERVRDVYRAFNAEDRMEYFKFNGGHEFDGPSSILWLMNRL